MNGDIISKFCEMIFKWLLVCFYFFLRCDNDKRVINLEWF